MGELLQVDELGLQDVLFVPGVGGIVGSAAVLAVRHIPAQQSPKMPLVDHNDLIDHARERLAHFGISGYTPGVNSRAIGTCG
jgi:hypothetical protein